MLKKVLIGVNLLCAVLNATLAFFPPYGIYVVLSTLSVAVSLSIAAFIYQVMD